MIPIPHDREQLPLPFMRDEKMLEDYLREMTGKDLSLTLTDNATVMISVRKKRMAVAVRLQRIFLSAADEVLHEIARFVKAGRGETPLVRGFIRQHCGGFKRRTSRVKPKTAGRYHDLRALYESVNNEYFGGSVRAVITWGRRNPAGAVRRRTLGSYNSAAQTIRLNTVLDKRNVPSFFVEFIVYHEMLHADMGTEKKGSRRAVHTREFRRREKLFREYERAVEWEKGWMAHK